jgi:hypothetical protein
LKSFLQPLIDGLPSLASSFPSSFAGVTTVQTVQATWEGIASQFNLFMLLRTFPVGTTSLLSFETSVQTPLGTPLGLDAGPLLGIIGWGMVLVLLGWIIGAVYYYWISVAALKPEVRLLWKPLIQALLLSVIWMALLFFFGLPAMLVLSLITFLSPALGQIALFIGAMLLVWMLMPVFFSAHGIFTLQLNAFRSILSSLRMVRYTLPNTGLFLLAFLVINQGLNFLWNTPQQDSWWMLVGIVGHAFISTALLAASFVYYRDINVWLKTVFELLQRQTTSAKA